MQLAKNKKAFHDYEILEKFEAGVVFSGDEVKSVRNKAANLKGSFVNVFNEEAFAENIHISQYSFSSDQNYSPTRGRKLLLKKKEIEKIEKATNTQGITCVPLALYTKGGLIKMEIGLCRGKKLHDKRHDLKKKDLDIDAGRALRNQY